MLRLVAFFLTALTVLPAIAQEPASQATANEGTVSTLEGNESPAQITCELAMAPARSDNEATQAPNRLAVTGSRIGEHYGREWSDIEVWLTLALLGFTVGLAGMVVFLAKTAQHPWSPQSILRVLGVVLIVPLAVMLVVAGYSEKQIASVMGLLGVIVGYLLGNGDRSRVNT